MRFLLPQLLILIFAAEFGAQSPTATYPCPSITIQEPAGITQPGEQAAYQVIVSDGAKWGKLGYEWMANNGKVVAGQGTDSIVLIFLGHAGYRVTVKVTGLPTRCESTAAVGLHFTIDPGPEKVGEVTDPSYHIGNRLMSKVAKAARDNPNAQLYFILNFPVGSRESHIRTVRNRVVNQLRKRGIAERRVTIQSVMNGPRKAVIWLIRPGVTNPVP